MRCRLPLIKNALSVLVLLVSCITLLPSCQKEVQINLASTPPQLVVQGSIETGEPPFVILTTTMGFFSNIDFNAFAGTFVHGAIVTVSDGSKTITLKEYEIDTAGNKFSVYAPDAANFIIGEVGKIYTLNVQYNGASYSATTRIPEPRGLDSLWFGEPTFKRNSTPDNAQELFGNYTDPDTPGNYVRYYTSRNGQSFLAGGVFSDQLVNGKVINSVDLIAGYTDTGNSRSDSLLYFYPGDTVVLKWCNIDKGVYDFWNTYEFAIRSGGNPFSSPINVQTNLSNGALGVWAGYGTIFTTLVVR